MFLYIYTGISQLKFITGILWSNNRLQFSCSVLGNKQGGQSVKNKISASGRQMSSEYYCIIVCFQYHISSCSNISKYIA